VASSTKDLEVVEVANLFAGITAVGGTSIEGKRNRSACHLPALRIRFPSA
jgi:hypothetical protein